MTTLNQAIAVDTKNLGSGYQIGHSYFCPEKQNLNYGEEWYRSIIRSEIKPLLYEYWFDDKMKADSLIDGLLS
jgi:5-methylcytosine-specific restriction enzyme B